MTNRDDDIVLRFLDAMRQAGASFTEDVAVQAELHIRQELGGERHYIARSPKRGKAIALGSAIRSGANITEAMRKVGVSRGYGFKLMAVKLR